MKTQHHQQISFATSDELATLGEEGPTEADERGFGGRPTGAGALETSVDPIDFIPVKAILNLSAAGAKGAVGLLVGLADDAVKPSSKVLLNSTRQLQAKFKHADDFGIVGNYNKANASKFSSEINKHINSLEVRTITGTYRSQPVIHYLNPNSGLNVISSPSGQFISGWKLNSGQLQNVLKHGGL